MKKKIFIFITTVLVFIVVFYIISNKTIKSNNGVFVNGIKIGEETEIAKYNSNTYVSYDLLADNELIDYYFDIKTKTIYIYENFVINTIVLNKTESTVYKIIDDKIFLNLNYIKNKLSEDFEISESINSIFFENNYSVLSNNKEIWVHEKQSGNSAKLLKLKTNSIITLYDTQGRWCLVRIDGVVGYIHNYYLSKLSTVSSNKELFNENKKNIVLAWDFFTKQPKEFIEDPIYPAINVVSPTWHALDDKTYDFSDWSIDEYFNYYSTNNIEVWGLFSNSFDPDLSSIILNDSKIRSQTVKKIIAISKDKNYKGINIDFENINLEDKDEFSAFIKELYIELRKENIILSVNVAVISSSPNWSLFYDRKVIGKYSDFVLLMAYDERTRPEHGIGSVASLPWVEEGIQGLLEYTPANKIVLGVPFYTRLWETIYSNGKYSYDVTALKLLSADNFINKNDFLVNYDKETGQNYGEKTVDNIKYQIWIEDEISLGNRIELIKKYNLNGISVWCLNYSKYSMWELIDRKLDKSSEN